MSRADLQRVWFPVFPGQATEYSVKNTQSAPSYEAIIERLVRSIDMRWVSPSQPVSNDTDYPLITRMSSTRGLPWAFGK